MSRSARVVLLHEQTEQRAILGPGDFVGRSEVAALCIDDPRISEAHAMVSLREGSLKLIGLRGRFRHDREVLSEIKLTTGLTLELARGVSVLCEQVDLPRKMLGLRIDEQLEVLLTDTMTLFTKPETILKRGYDPGGEAIFWTAGSMWSVSIGGAPAAPLTAGESFEVGQSRVEVVSIPIARAAQPRTRHTMRAPFLLRDCDTHLKITPDGEDPVMISGVPGKIMLSLLRRGGSATCQDVMSDVWFEDLSPQYILRRRFDSSLRRLREHLQCILAEGEELIVLDGTGLVVLKLGEHDRIGGDDEAL